MAADAPTMLLLSNAIAFVAAVFLIIEWRSLGERFLLSFAGGFLCIVVGCTLAPMRMQGSFLIGIWLSNSMVPLAHLCFLHGAAAFADRRLHPGWFMTPLFCSACMALPGLPSPDQTLSLFNAACVALLSIKAASVLFSARRESGSETRMLVSTFLVHGTFYTFKALCAFAPGAFIDLSHYSGTLIPLSLFEGILVEVALAMSIAGALRRRREDVATRLAESDPLTGLLNRRGFEGRVDALRSGGGGTLLLIDIDNFKTINDCFGHQEGDRLLVALADFLRARAPVSAITARLGGDEFAIVLPDTDERVGLQFAEDLCAGFALRQRTGNCGTLSIGCAAFGPRASDLSDAHLLADRGLYDAKSKGRNRASIARDGEWEPDVRSGPLLFPLAAAG